MYVFLLAVGSCLYTNVRSNHSEHHVASSDVIFTVNNTD